MAKRGPKMMTDEHKAALDRGRNEGRAVRDYLEALRANKSKRGRKRTSESIGKRLQAIEEQIRGASAIDELNLIQERRDLIAEVESLGDTVDLSALEDAFVAVARAYGDRKRIAYISWREVGVSAATLARAGIKR